MAPVPPAYNEAQADARTKVLNQELSPTLPKTIRQLLEEFNRARAEAEGTVMQKYKINDLRAMDARHWGEVATATEEARKKIMKQYDVPQAADYAVINEQAKQLKIETDVALNDILFMRSAFSNLQQRIAFEAEHAASHSSSAWSDELNSRTEIETAARSDGKGDAEIRDLMPDGILPAEFNKRGYTRWRDDAHAKWNAATKQILANNERAFQQTGEYIGAVIKAKQQPQPEPRREPGSALPRGTTNDAIAAARGTQAIPASAEEEDGFSVSLPFAHIPSGLTP